MTPVVGIDHIYITVSDLARSQAPHFAEGTAELARRWLGGDWR